MIDSWGRLPVASYCRNSCSHISTRLLSVISRSHPENDGATAPFNPGTDSTSTTSPTPRAMVAENDLALGKLVEAISGSSIYWKDSALFVVEDDSQAGPDHVDSHRSVVLVASPFAKRAFVDHTFYTTSGVLRTMELILGLPPMSQYDAAATPLFNAFQGTPNLTAYRRIVPAVSLDEKNPATA